MTHGMTDNAAHTYITERVRRGEIQPATGMRVRSILGSFADSVGARKVSAISRLDVERWMGERGHLAPATRRHEFSTVRCFVRWLVRTGRLRRDPTIGMTPPRVPRAAGRALSRDETEAIERVLPDNRARVIYALMRWVGLRRAEVLRLELGDWDRRAGTIRIVGKGGHTRDEPVPPWVAEPMASYVAEMRITAGPLIRTADGRRGISHGYLGNLMRAWMEECGVKTGALDGRGSHSLRHTIASEMIESGADVRTVQELLGHVSLTSTQVYLRRASVSRVRAAMDVARVA